MRCGPILRYGVTNQLRAFGWSNLEISEWRAASLIEPYAIKPDLATIERDLSIERWFD